MAANTELSGANKERTAWLAKVRRESRASSDAAVKAVLDNLVKWGLTRNERYQKAAGRLGK